MNYRLLNIETGKLCGTCAEVEINATHEELDLRQLHAHEHSGHEEAEEDADKADEEQQEAVEFGDVWGVGAVQDYKAQASHREEETGSQSFHNVLPIYSGEQTHLH